MALVADVRITWVPSPSASVTRQVVVLNVDGTETTFDVDVGADSWDTTLHANATCSVRIDSYADESAVPSETLEFSIPAAPAGGPGIEPAADLVQELSGWHDDTLGAPTAVGRGRPAQQESTQPARPQAKGARPAAARAAAGPSNRPAPQPPGQGAGKEKAAGPPESVVGRKDRP